MLSTTSVSLLNFLWFICAVIKTIHGAIRVVTALLTLPVLSLGHRQCVAIRLNFNNSNSHPHSWPSQRLGPVLIAATLIALFSAKIRIEYLSPNLTLFFSGFSEWHDTLFGRDQCGCTWFRHSWSWSCNSNQSSSGKLSKSFLLTSSFYKWAFLFD